MVKKNIRSIKFYIGVLALIVATKLNFLAGQFALKRFQEVVSPDLFFSITPYWQITQSLSDIAVIAGFVIILYYILKNKSAEMPYYLVIFAIGYFFRAILVPLTPLRAYLGTGVQYGMTNLQPNGSFPSGHVMFIFLVFFLLPKEEKTLRLITLIFAFIEIFALIFSRGHYSIDIVGGFLLAFFIAKSFTFLKKPLTINENK